MSSPLLRSALTTASRRTHHVRCTSLPPPASNLHSKSLSTLALPSHGKSGDDAWLTGRTRASLGFVDDENIMSKAMVNIKSNIASMITNLTGNGVLVTLDSYQVSKTEEERGIVPNEALATLMDTASSAIEELSLWLISTLKRRKKMMNKHKLRKRRKKLRLKSKK